MANEAKTRFECGLLADLATQESNLVIDELLGIGIIDYSLMEREEQQTE